MNAMKNKIKSQRGASITFALLLFLVCAIISSIVIVAATAVGGRASQMAELDQRYYAVNSAAELLRDVLEGQTVVVTTGTKTVSTVDQTGTEVTSEGKTTTVLPEKLILKGTTDMDISSDTSLVSAAAKMLAEVDGATLSTDPISLSVTGVDNKTATALGVTMSANMDTANRNLYIDAVNTDTSKGRYTLNLTFKANMIQDDNVSTTYSAPLPKIVGGKIQEGQYTRKKTEEKTKVSTIKWKLIDMQTVVATTASSTESTGG